MIDANFIRGFRTTGHQTFEARDVILYALGVGATVADRDRRYIYEKELQPIPTLAAILAREPFWLNDPRTGIDMTKLLQGEQTLAVHRPLPTAGEMRSELYVAGLYDKGPDKGAILDLRRELYDAGSGDHLATIGIRSMLRANGGFGGDSVGLPVPHPAPDEPAEQTIELATRPEQALIYRLSGDYNPIHVEPEIGRRAGFAGPILHGLCTYGIAARAILRGVLHDEAARLRQFDARFSSPVYPGETILTDIWPQGVDQVAFRCRVAERGVTVIQNGLARFE